MAGGWWEEVFTGIAGTLWSNKSTSQKHEAQRLTNETEKEGNRKRADLWERERAVQRRKNETEGEANGRKAAIRECVTEKIQNETGRI